MREVLTSEIVGTVSNRAMKPFPSGSSQLGDVGAAEGSNHGTISHSAAEWIDQAGADTSSILAAESQFLA